MPSCLLDNECDLLNYAKNEYQLQQQQYLHQFSEKTKDSCGFKSLDRNKVDGLHCSEDLVKGNLGIHFSSEGNQTHREFTGQVSESNHNVVLGNSYFYKKGFENINGGGNDDGLYNTTTTTNTAVYTPFDISSFLKGSPKPIINLPNGKKKTGGFKKFFFFFHCCSVQIPLHVLFKDKMFSKL